MTFFVILYDMFCEHAERVAGMDGGTGANGRDAHRMAAEVGARRWEPEPWCTYFAGGIETVEQLAEGGKTEKIWGVCLLTSGFRIGCVGRLLFSSAMSEHHVTP